MVCLRLGRQAVGLVWVCQVQPSPAGPCGSHSKALGQGVQPSSVCLRLLFSQLQWVIVGSLKQLNSRNTRPVQQGMWDEVSSSMPVVLGCQHAEQQVIGFTSCGQPSVEAAHMLPLAVHELKLCCAALCAVRRSV